MSGSNYLLKFGPEQRYAADRDGAYIALADGRTAETSSSDRLISERHQTFDAFKAEVEQLHQELDRIVEEARAYFDRQML